jgi:hypothetical protein
MAFPYDENHNITFTAGAVLTKRYRDSMKNGDVKGGYFSRAAILALLDQENCAGIRIYFGLDIENKQELVVVGADRNGNDLIGTENLCMDTFIKCPNECG